MYLSEVRYCHYQLVSESKNFIHPAIHNLVSLSLNSGVSVQPGKESHKINSISTNTTTFEEKIPDQIRATVMVSFACRVSLRLQLLGQSINIRSTETRMYCSAKRV